jgi:hypothetical protein
LPRLDFDVDFAWHKDGVHLARLNEFGDALELTRDEFAVSLLFDGETTLIEAAARVWWSPESRSRKAGIARDLTQRVTAGGLIYS